EEDEEKIEDTHKDGELFKLRLGASKVLGNINIGDNVRIGAGSIVLRHVPSDCTVVGIPGKVVSKSGQRAEVLEHGKLPDTEATVIRALVDRIEQLEEKLQTIMSDTR
ncbi:MAG: hypothetical protein O4808_03465, partial [Trichodesmium sp. St17_bin3_1_1]|nr:hypothetical protein [Trichodesmium sp. St17_bin3_1_1]